MDIQVNIFSIDGDCYGLYKLERMDKANYRWGNSTIGIQDGEMYWRFIRFNPDNSYPTIHVDDDDHSCIKFKPEHINENQNQYL